MGTVSYTDSLGVLRNASCDQFYSASGLGAVRPTLAVADSMSLPEQRSTSAPRVPLHSNTT